METTKTKKPAVIRDLRKVKALLFLSMRQQTEFRAASARQIAIATGGNPDSLYVLLQRWTKWGLVQCLDSTPYFYMIAPEGLRYLSKVPNWFFSGYYSKKRRKRMPGYRGKVKDLKREIAIASKAIFWWRWIQENWYGPAKDPNRGIAYYMKAPFKEADHLVKIEKSEGRPIGWSKVNLLVVRFNSALEAFRYLPEWGFEKTVTGLGQAIVDAKVGMVWRDDA